MSREYSKYRKNSNELFLRDKNLAHKLPIVPEKLI